MNFQDFIVYDIETGSRNPHTTQPLQIAAIVIDGRRLVLKENAVFKSLIRPILDEEELAKEGFAKVEEEALNVNHLTFEGLKDAPLLKNVMTSFVDFVKLYNYKGDLWSAPILCGFNNNGFDDVIMTRLLKKFGFWDEEKGKNAVFHPAKNVDVMKMVFPWFENTKMETSSFSLDALRDYFGMSKEGAHDALVDVYDTAEIMVRFLKMHRHFMDNGLIEMKGRFSERILKPSN